jgi:hypothetical protein
MNTRIRAAIVTVAAFVYLSPAVPAFADPTITASPHVVATLSRSAPADEYFGPLKLSILGVRNTISDSEVKLDRGGMDSDRMMKHLALIEASVREWESKYPRDSWLPRTVLDLHRVYRKIATAEASLHSVDVASWLLHKYGATHEAQALRAELAEAMQNPVSTASADDEAVAMPTVVEKE